MADPQYSYQKGLAFVHSLLSKPEFAGGRPRFTTAVELDRFLRNGGFTLTENGPFGPDHPDARQLIYEGPNNVIVKVKTLGYKPGGPPKRVGKAFLSVEVADGKGTGWDNALFKVDAQGKIIAKNLIDINEEVVRLPADHPDRKKFGSEWGVKNAKTGDVRGITKFEVIQGGQDAPINKQAWADRGHLDLPDNFNPAGASGLGRKGFSAPT